MWGEVATGQEDVTVPSPQGGSWKPGQAAEHLRLPLALPVPINLTQRFYSLPPLLPDRATSSLQISINDRGPGC